MTCVSGDMLVNYGLLGCLVKLPVSAMAPTKKEQQFEMRFLAKEGLSAKQIHDRLIAVHGQNAVSRTTVQRWLLKFRIDPDNVSDMQRSGRPRVQDPGNIDKVRQVLAADKRTSVRQAARTTGLSRATTHRIIQKDLSKTKKPAKWVPHLLTQPQRNRRVLLARAALALLRRRNNAVEHVVAEDESWFWVWDPDSKRSSAQWLDPGEERPQKARQEQSTAKVMLVLFFDRQGVVYREWVPNGVGINANLYIDILERMRVSLRHRRPRLWSREVKWALLHDGAPAHRCRDTIRYLNYHGFTLMPHPGYSPDISPCDYWIFRKLKTMTSGVRYRNIGELTAAVDQAMNNIAPQEFADAMDRYPVRLRKLIAEQGRYFERT